MIAKVLIILFQVIPLIIATLAFVLGAIYLKVKDEQAQSEVS